MPFATSRYHTRHWHLQVVTLCCLSIFPAARAATAGSLTPATLSALVRASAEANAGGGAIRLRGSNTVVVLPVGGAQAGMVLRADAGASEAVRYRAVRVNGSEISKGECAPGDEKAVAFPAGVRCLIQVDAGETPTTLELRNAGFGLRAGPAGPAHFDGAVTRQRFFVPKGTHAFTVTARAEGGSGKAEVLDPTGKPAAGAALAADHEAPLRVTVGREGTGRFWSVSTQPAATGGFTGVSLELSSEIPPFLAPDDGAMALPFIHYTAGGALLLGDGDRSATVEAVIVVEPQADRFVRAQMTRTGSSRALWTTRPSPFTTGRVRILLPKDIAPGAYDLKTTLLDDRGTVVATHDQRIHAARGFAHVGEERPLMELLCLPALSPRTPLPRGEGGHGGDGAAAAYRLQARLALDPSCYSQVSVRMALYRDGSRQPAFKEDFGRPKEAILPIQAPKDAPGGLYRMALSLVGPAEKALATVDRSFYLEGGRCFLEALPRPSAKKTSLRKDQRARGYVLFTREYHEAFPYNYQPPREDIGRPLYVWATPGELEPATFGVYAVKPLQKARVQVGLLSRVGGGGVIDPSQVDVRLARLWPQRTGDRSTTFRLVPELLERVTTADIPTGRVSQYWLTLRIPPGTPAGDYRGLVTYRPDNAPASHLKLLVKVLPFGLARPATRTWGLYADSARWRDYPDAAVEQEMRDMKAHGIDALALSALAHGSLTYTGGKLAVDFAPLSRLMGIYKRAGLRGPIVLDLRDLCEVAARARGAGAKPGDPEVQRLAMVALSELAVCATQEGWPDAVYQLANEPDARRPESLATARAILSVAKRAALTTMLLLAEPEGASQELAALLGIPCYGADAVASDKAAALRKALKEAKKPYWWHGSGSMTPAQEANVLSNRYLAGVAFWRSGAAAHWAWTYQQPRGDAYSDFDGGGAKDACLTYPAPGGKASVPTIQWEGIREGFDDFRYLYTFQEMVGRAKRSGNARAANYAAQVEKEAQERLGRLPWGAEPERLTAYDLHAFRKWLSKYMGTLVNKMRT